MEAHKDVIRTVGDFISHGVWISAVVKLLPPIAATLSIAWTMAQLYDRFFKKKRHNTTSTDK